MTSGSLLDSPKLERLMLFEIEPAVLPATELFASWNHDLVHDPRVAVRIADGRHALARSGERFDLITADPVHPWSHGSSDLYTLEHFRAMSAHLAPRGVASQWLPLYELSTRDVRTIVATWVAAFAHTEAYLTAYDLALIGSNEPLAADLSRSVAPPEVAARLAEVGVHSGVELAALEVADDAALRAWIAGVAPMRDDLPSVEFRAPLSYLHGYADEVLRWCARPEFVEALPEASRGRAREVRALVLDFLERLPSGKSAAAASYGRALLALPALRADGSHPR
jgi:spermidine synthase